MVIRKLSIILFLFLLFASPVRADSHTVRDISKQLICQCGCTLVLHSCTHAECGAGVPMTALIKQKLAQGQSGEEIIQFFVAQYGEQVLASPPKRGFNLTVWVLPFVAILGGGGVVYMALKKWVWKGRQSTATAETEVEEEEYQRRLEKELEEFTEEGFR